MLHKVKAAIFDMDGVLVDSMPIHRLAWEKAFKPYGIEVAPEAFKKTPGMTFLPVIELLSNGRKFSDQEIENLVAVQRETVESILHQHYPVMPGAPELIKKLDETGWRLGIGTSGPRTGLQYTLDNLPESQRFQAFATCEDITHGKPDPAVFLKVAERLGVSPDQAVVVEDSLAGLEAAERGGFRSVGLVGMLDAGQLEPLADLVVDSLYKISPEILEALFS